MNIYNAELQEGALEPILDASLTRPRIGKGVFFNDFTRCRMGTSKIS